MHIRFFREADYQPVAALLNAVDVSPTRKARMTAERLRSELANRDNNPHENFLVLEGPSGVVGFCGYDPMAGGRALLDGPVLAPELRRQGWGKRLFEELSAVMSIRGIRHVAVVLGEENEAGEAFLTHLGFRLEKTDVIVVCDTPSSPVVAVPDGVQVELAGPDLDLSAYEDLHARLFSRRSLNYLALLARSSNYRIFVARRGQELVGHLELEFLDDVATLEAYGVLPEHRRQGIGKALLAAALREAWAQPGVALVRQIWNTTEPGFIKVYLEMGFEQKYAIRGMVRELEKPVTPVPE
ncbi:MAG: GNAT family N-acetyltransferase [Candidatus Eremiobacterota bacterium]